MRTLISRWFLFGLLLGWALTHATVFAQAGKTTDPGPATVDKLRQGLDKTVTIDYTGQSLSDALNHFRDKTGLAIHLDPAMFLQMGDPMAGGGQVTIKGTNEKASQILRRTLNAYRLSYVVFEDGLLITSEDMAVMRQMRQRVSVNLDEIPLKKAVRDLAKNHGLNLIIDPKVAKQAETPVTLQLENSGIETTLRLIAEMASLKAVRMGNVMFITTEEKAKKIREEEAHQFDNPLNPNLQGLPMPAMGFGNFGGIAMPARAVPFAPPIEIAPPAGIDAPPVPVRPIDPIKKGAIAPVNPPPPPPPAVQRPGLPPVPAPPAPRP